MLKYHTYKWRDDEKGIVFYRKQKYALVIPRIVEEAVGPGMLERGHANICQIL